MTLGTETETLEFKKSTGELKEAVISIVAILNKHQKGELYFGVLNDGTPKGQTVSDKTLRDISQAVNSRIEPKIFPSIEKVVIDGCDCIRVSFEGYDTPYFVSGVAKIRVADEDLTLSPQQLAEYMRRRNESQNSWESHISGFSVDQADESTVKDYIKRGKEAGRITFEYTDKKTVLNKLLLTKDAMLLNAGMVLFCTNRFCELQMAIFAGTERLTFNDINRSYGTVFELSHKAERYIIDNMHWGVIFDGSLERKEIPEVPVEAIREALINSFCHKDYNACEANEVAIFKDRIEIYNPGTFPKDRKPEDYIEREERPVRRNPLIANILYYSKDIESFGTGLRRIYDACKANGTKVEFRTEKAGFTVVFYRRDLHETKAEQKMSAIGSENDSDTRAETGGETRVETRDKILELLRKNPEITAEMMSGILGLSLKGIEWQLKTMKEKGLIRRVGPNKGGYWEIIK